jgi:tetratricopeptide (TPR) repeat protein/predicted Ser/Thr protein kinase
VHAPERDTQDEELLAAAFDRAVDALAEGREVSIEELGAGHEDLHERLSDVLRLAREITARPALALPVVPGYEIERELGRGGMDSVYLARQARVGGRRVALKVLPQLATASSRARERFATEVRALSKLAHPHVVAIHDVVIEREVCAYAMDWIDGRSLADELRAGGSSSDRIARLCEVARTIARALHAAHEAGIVHRDVKPSNILLRHDGTPLLGDFGLARDDESATATQSGAFVGTPAYAAPEQLRGEVRSIDARSDVYSLGATLYHAATSTVPFQGRSTARILEAMERGRLAPLRQLDPKLPRDLETIVAKCLEADPARRYASAAELADDLDRLLSLQPIRARPAGWITRASELVRRNRAAAWDAIAGSIASLAAACAVVVYTFFVPRWVDEHVREARLALLDPSSANAVIMSAAWGMRDGELARFVDSSAMQAASSRYDAALRLRPFDAELREERDVVANASGEHVDAIDAWSARSRGLRAFLEGRIDAALDAWSTCESARDPLSAPDPLIEAGLGILHLARDEPAPAYARLRQANQAFPDVGFLATYLADAALRCGDMAVAEATLERATRMPRLDPLGGLERVRADWLAAMCRDEEAESSYRSLRQSPIAHLHLARFLDARDRHEDAATELARLPTYRFLPEVRAEIAAMLERWWNALNHSGRRRHIAAALELPPTDPRSLAARGRILLHVRERSPSRPRILDALVNPLACLSSPPLESLGLPELAEILEVDDMPNWDVLADYAAPLRWLQLVAWRAPCAEISNGLVRRIHLFMSPFKRAGVWAASIAGLSTFAVADVREYYAALGTLPTAQGWQTLDSGNHPAVYMVNSELHQGPTVSNCSPGYQYFYVDDAPFDFHCGVTLEAELRVIASNDVHMPSMGCSDPAWRAGYYLQINDSDEHLFYVGITSSAVFLANAHVQDPTTYPRIAVDTTQGFHTYRLEISMGVATLFYDGTPLTSLPIGTDTNPGAANQADFGDTSHAGGSETLLRWARLTTQTSVVSYCTAGTTTNGCNASMSAIGTPSVGAASGFTINCSNVEGQKFGLIFYGVNGPKASPWGPGSTSFLCVKAPVQRTPPENSGGTAGACDGAFSLDFLSYLSTHPGALGQPFAPGQCVNAQTWFRDPPAPETTNLSNGLQFTTVP